ncbi:uncharacterized protein LOC128681251 [Plodia interpunctella]|uniref:uncharacterized protein LOC128681251 n=1 Tax=Plodia interpunctella TaxID=58824 RepID=UPI0023683621|nr:uncharacterized protein LOC128681251 [Plodia interpunctella]
MEFLKFVKKHIHIILLCFVSPSCQLINDNVKSIHNNAIGNSRNQLAVDANKIIAARRQPVITPPLHISPQPLITKKVLVNPHNSAKTQRTAINKAPIGATVHSNEVPKKDIIQNKNNDTKVDSESKSEEKHFEDEAIDDFNILSGKDNADKLNSVSLIPQNNERNETKSNINEVSPKLEDIVEKNLKNNTQNASENFDTHRFIASNNLKDIVEEMSVKENMTSKITDELTIDKIKPNQKENVSPSVHMKLEDKKSNLKNSEVSINNNDKVKPTKGSVRKSGYRNIQNPNFMHKDDVPITTKLELNVDPKVMEKLTNDANDKIFIKNSNFEELREKYNKPSFKDTFNEDITDLNNNLSEILKEEIDLNKIKSPNANDFFKNDSPTDRVWRKWENTEIHIKSNGVKDIQQNTILPQRDICDCYSNAGFNPIEYTTSQFDPPVYQDFISTQNPTRYYLPYTSYPTCYKPQSYGDQYAPVSRYQKYIFPCL